MKKILFLLIAIFTLFIASCQAVPGEKDNANESTCVPTTEPESATEKTEELPVQKYTFEDMNKGPVYPAGAKYAYEPAVSMRADVTEYPDTLDSFSGMEDSFANGILHIAALDLDLEVPEGYSLYRLSGHYWDLNEDRNVSLAFVREYVFTMMKVPEEKLLQDMSEYFHTSHNWEDPEYRGPGYVVFSFRVFRKEYLPIESLFTSQLADTGECFSHGNYYVSMGRETWGGDEERGYRNIYDPAAIDPNYEKYQTDEELIAAKLKIKSENWPVKQWIRTITDNTDDHGFYSESFLTLESGSPTPFFYAAKSMFRSGTASYYVRTAGNKGSRLYKLQIANPDASTLSAEWWNAYQSALKELKENPEHYRYPEVRFSFARDSSITYQDKTVDEADRALRQGWYYDSEKDIELRAYIYANRSATEYRISLEEIMILVKDLDNGERLYGAFYVDLREPHYLRHLEWGWDALDEVDLDFSRDYAVQYIKP